MEAVRMSKSEFLLWAGTEGGRFELLDGRVKERDPRCREHERTAKRIFASLYAQVAEWAFDVNKGGFGVRVPAKEGEDTILYPDIVIDQQSVSGEEQFTDEPIVIIDVLPKGRTYSQYIRRLRLYRRSATFAQYVVVDRWRRRAFVWSRTNNQWPRDPVQVSGPEGVIPLPQIGAELQIGSLWRDAQRG